MELPDIVTAILKHAPGEPICDACLAFACEVGFAVMHDVTEDLIRSEPNVQRGRSCATCRRLVMSVGYHLRAGKCTHCSDPVDATDGLLVRGDVFHYTCLRRLISDETLRLSRELNARSRALIEQSRRRLRSCRGVPPRDAAG
jgi:hypothetical protein